MGQRQGAVEGLVTSRADRPGRSAKRVRARDARIPDRGRRLYRRGHGAELLAARPRGHRARHRLLPRRAGSSTTARPRRAVISRDIRGVIAADDLAASTRSCTWPSSRTTRSASTTRARPIEINHHGLGRASPKPRKAAGVARFVYTSSCSVYGAGGGRVPTETSDAQAADRLRATARSWSSATCGARWTTTFSPIFMRNATAYGASPRMRFDIVLNNLCGLARTTGRDPHDQRRHAVAAAGPRRGHLRGDALRARRRRATRSPARSSTSAPTARTTASARSPRSWRGPSPAASSSSATAAATTAATGSPSTRSAQPCRSSAASWTAERGAQQLHGVFERIGPDDGDVRRRRPSPG